jgi:GNAT superfamily N-acetyltransferase
VWRTWQKAPGATDRERKRAALEARARDGTPIGLLGYLDGEPVAWCAVAPRKTFRPLGGVEDADASTVVWSVVCFFVPRAARGRGMAGAMLDAAIARARDAGADVLEAYPVVPDSPSYRFMGFTPMFLERGFEEQGMAGTRRHVMRLDLRAPSGAAAG